MLDRMNQEIENLRKILGAHEDKMTEAGSWRSPIAKFWTNSFWAAVPDSGKRAGALFGRGLVHPAAKRAVLCWRVDRTRDIAEAISILQNYAACADSEDATRGGKLPSAFRMAEFC